MEKIRNPIAFQRGKLTGCKVSHATFRNPAPELLGFKPDRMPPIQGLEWVIIKHTN